LASISPVNPPNENDSKKPNIKNKGVIKKNKLDHKVSNQFSNFIPVGTPIIDVEEVKYARESISKPTANIWCPQTMQPNKPIRNNAINILSLPKIINCVNLVIIVDTKPKAGNISMYTSGWPKNQNRCWNRSKSPPLSGSKKQLLKCLSEIIIVIHAANTGIDIINNNDVKKIDQLNNSIKLNRYNNENDDTLKMLDMKFIAPNNELKPARCKLKNNKSIEL
jgi:hypothetical protein